jgi:lipoprotein signal peptidase
MKKNIKLWINETKRKCKIERYLICSIICLAISLYLIFSTSQRQNSYIVFFAMLGSGGLGVVQERYAIRDKLRKLDFIVKKYSRDDDKK